VAYRLEGRGLIPGRGKIFCLLHSVQTDSGADPAPNTMGAGALSPEVKQPGREANHSPPSDSEVKNGGAVPPLPERLHGAMLN
jgi:hypothetical protein